MVANAFAQLALEFTSARRLLHAFGLKQAVGFSLASRLLASPLGFDFGGWS
jgi:hypothetical protein